MDRKTRLGAQSAIAQLQGWNEAGDRDAIRKRTNWLLGEKSRSLSSLN